MRRTACAAALLPALARTLRFAALLALSFSARAQDFALVAVGDLIISRPLSMLQQPGAFEDAVRFADAITVLGQGDVTYGNLETSIYDTRNFTGAPYAWDGDWPLTSVTAVANDLRAMHFNVVSRANNHALDWGVEGMRETGRWVDAAGLMHAGAGEDSAQASAPHFFQSSKGKVGIISVASTFRPTTDALPVSAAAPRGRPGVNALRLAETSIVDRPAYELAVTLACHFAGSTPCPGRPLTDSVDLFGTRIRSAKAGEIPFTFVYEMNEADVARIMDSIKAGKQNARYVLVTIHAHEALSGEDPPKSWQNPAGFLRSLAHRAIDNGADAFVTTGIHHVAGIEIYRGKPIFFGLGNFFWSDIQEPISADLYGASANRALLARSFYHPDRVSDADLSLVMNANSTFATPGDKALNRTFHTVITRSVYEGANGRIREIRLYPIDLGYGEKLTRSGVPRRALAPIANLILDRMIELSANAGVKILKVEDGPYIIGIATPN